MRRTRWDRRVVAGCAAAVLVAVAGGVASAQTDLYSNGSADPGDPGLSTGALTASGVAAPPGAAWSEAQRVGGEGGEANAVAGFSSHLAGALGGGEGAPHRFADDFTVLGPEGWRLTAVSFFAYQTGAPGPLAPFGALNLRVWRGRPGDEGSAVVFGDTTADRLLAAASADLYRVFSTVAPPLASPGGPETSRLIWRAEAGVGGDEGLILEPGTYWLDWQYTSVDPAGEIFSPPVTVVGSRGLPGWNARQFRTVIEEGGTVGAWMDVIDGGKPGAAADVPQDLPFIIRGDLVPPSCPADIDGDGEINSNDFFAFLTGYFAGNGDFDGDGTTNSNDFFAFLTAFFEGC